MLSLHLVICFVYVTTHLPIVLTQMFHSNCMNIIVLLFIVLIFIVISIFMLPISFIQLIFYFFLCFIFDVVFVYATTVLFMV